MKKIRRNLDMESLIQQKHHIQTYKHTDKRTYRHTDINTSRHTDIKIYRNADIWKYKHTDTQTYRHTYGISNKQIFFSLVILGLESCKTATTNFSSFGKNRIHRRCCNLHSCGRI